MRQHLPLVLEKGLYLEVTEGCVDKLDWALQRVSGCAHYILSALREGGEALEDAEGDGGMEASDTTMSTDESS